MKVNMLKKIVKITLNMYYVFNFKADDWTFITIFFISNTSLTNKFKRYSKSTQFFLYRHLKFNFGPHEIFKRRIRILVLFHCNLKIKSFVYKHYYITVIYHSTTRHTRHVYGAAGQFHKRSLFSSSYNYYCV